MTIELHEIIVRWLPIGPVLLNCQVSNSKDYSIRMDYCWGICALLWCVLLSLINFGITLKTTKLFKVLLLAASLGALAPTQAATQLLTFSGTGAHGDVAGASFSNQTWSLDFLFNDATANSYGPGNSGLFENAITAGHLTLGGVQYTLFGKSAAGRIFAGFNDAGYQVVFANFSDFGFVDVTSGKTSIFPFLFSDSTSLASANLGSTLYNTIADPYNSLSVLDAIGNHGFDTEVGRINVSSSSPAGSGLSSVGVSSPESFIVSTIPEPETYALMLVGLGVMGAVTRRRNSHQA